MGIWHKIDTITRTRAEGVYLSSEHAPTKSLNYPK
nr:MAG TPA: hypothetical protein [Bacteriophage sp.]